MNATAEMQWRSPFFDFQKYCRFDGHSCRQDVVALKPLASPRLVKGGGGIIHRNHGRIADFLRPAGQRHDCAAIVEVESNGALRRTLLTQPEENGCVCRFQAADGIGNIGTRNIGIRDVEAVEMPAPQVMKRLRTVPVGTVRDHKQ
jgi:hypothetical protein